MILLIDNYDSFVFNVKTMLESLCKDEIYVVRNDKISLDEIRHLNPTHIILSPGPKHPKDSGICLEIFKARLNIPVLGICLGHQALGLSFGAKISVLKQIAHAQNSKIKIINESEIFKDFIKEFSIMRYHSLEVSDLPECLQALAYSEDGVLMAMRHKELPYFGVQFHPESYFSEYGLKFFANFLNADIKKEKNIKDFTPYLQKLSDNVALESDDFEEVCELIMSENFEPIQLAALLVLITEKSLNQESLSYFVRSILRYSKTFVDDSEMLDIVGTGGDGFKTINISTTSAFILASMGVKVAKHGNKAMTSKSGSSDVLEALNIPLGTSLQDNLALLEDTGLSFFHAGFFHPLVGRLREIRVKLGIRTVFNVLGPLMHPNLKLKYQLMGNYHAPVHRLLAQVLQMLGRKHALIVRGNDGMDELSICDETKVFEVSEKEILEYNVSPEQFGFKRAFHSDITGGSPEENAVDLIATLSGTMKGAKFDVVILNTMFALYTANIVDNPLKAKDMILEHIHSGKCLEYFKNFQEKSKIIVKA
ncbi:anthranilate phosphoribosyltransferase [Campylobacter sp. LR286c]|uniref:anthranilate phosphoribosyltransferase n=1 Tax=Campylobacter sp. LR286c TaxID=2593545 RepID=UPI001237ABA6|nr:anthranilate phosphoribosyltransferase [Campylobacter sp. LR286c]KAA6228513.1 anthranilate phosphoribosyltransferase [Campylobacter sp. LR286c]